MRADVGSDVDGLGAPQASPREKRTRERGRNPMYSPSFPHSAETQPGCASTVMFRDLTAGVSGGRMRSPVTITTLG